MEALNPQSGTQAYQQCLQKKVILYEKLFHQYDLLWKICFIFKQNTIINFITSDYRVKKIS